MTLTLSLTLTRLIWLRELKWIVKVEEACLNELLMMNHITKLILYKECGLYSDKKVDFLFYCMTSIKELSMAVGNGPGQCDLNLLFYHLSQMANLTKLMFGAVSAQECFTILSSLSRLEELFIICWPAAMPLFSSVARCPCLKMFFMWHLEWTSLTIAVLSMCCSIRLSLLSWGCRQSCRSTAMLINMMNKLVELRISLRHFMPTRHSRGLKYLTIQSKLPFPALCLLSTRNHLTSPSALAASAACWPCLWWHSRSLLPLQLAPFEWCKFTLSTITSACVEARSDTVISIKL